MPSRFRAAARLCGALLCASALPAHAQAPPATTPGVEKLPEVVVTAPPSATAPSVVERPTGQTVTPVPRDQFKDSPAFSAGQVLQYVPGVTIKQGNGPRDVGLSIRGSNARNGFGVRNIVVLEDGFPATQPDGLSRTDLTDPHAYGGIDVYRGPSSALFGNYATGGAVNFRTRSGAEIDGVEFGSDFGSFGYQNFYGAFGRSGESYDASGFASHVRGNGFIANSSYNTTTENLLGSYDLTPQDRLVLKLVNNDVDTKLPIRLSLNQYRLNPFQQGCIAATPGANSAGCGTVNLFTNGLSGAQSPATAEQAGLGRIDRRTIAGARWEHSFDTDTVWRTTAVFDNKDINQFTNATPNRGAQPAVDLITDVTRQGSVLGLGATHFAGLFFNYVDIDSSTFNLVPGGAPGGNVMLAGPTNTQFGQYYNLGGRAREEIRFTDRLTGVLGIGVEHTTIDVASTSFALFPFGGRTVSTRINAAREFTNVAPEAALLYRPAEEWQFRTRVSTGYGTPQTSSLFVTPQGTIGSNTQLKTQSNVGIDVGADWTPLPALRLSVTGFYEFFENEQVTQSPGAGLLNFTFNAPASQHRGVEVAGDWTPSPGWLLRLAWLYDDQYYSKYVEQLSAGTQSTSFSRAGNKIPGVEPNFFSARLGYDHADGILAGLGGFFEVVFRDEFFIDNANLVKVPAYELLNLNLHYDPGVTDSWFKGLRVFFEIQNLLDRTYVASANNVSDGISAATGLQNGAGAVANAGGSIYAGAPRSFFGGLKLKF
jgi:iron complex outermembrane receptor protein